MMRVMKRILGILILVTGISIFFYPNYRQWKVQKEMDEITEAFPENEPFEDMQDKTQENSKETEDSVTKEVADEQSVKKLTASKELFEAMQEYNKQLLREGQDISDAWAFEQVPDELVDLHSESDAVGYLEIPEISLSLPLYIGATETNMSKGAVVLTQTSMPIGGEGTNSVIAAHRGWKGSPYFRDIDQLTIGSMICIHNLWEELIYQVTGTEIIPATKCSILNIQQDKDMVTLFSCYPYMSPGTNYRLVIYCERVVDTEEKEIDESNTLSVKEVAKKDLTERGIVIKEDYMEDFLGKEGLFRVLLPALLILTVSVVILIRWNKRK